MYKKILLFIFFILLVLMVVVYNTNTLKPMHNTSTEEDLAPKISTSLKVTPAIEKNRLKNLSTVTKDSIKKEDKTSSQDITMQTITMYEPLSIEEAQLTTQVRKNIPPIAAIQINTEALNQVKIQDTLVLSDIEGIDYPLTIIRVEKNAASVTSTGAYVDEGITYTTTITLSDHESFISLATPKGLYEIETKDGVGYVYKTSDIRKKMQKSTVNDVIIFPIPKRGLKEE